jgi:hypothetical protein
MSEGKVKKRKVEEEVIDLTDLVSLLIYRCGCDDVDGGVCRLKRMMMGHWPLIIDWTALKQEVWAVSLDDSTMYLSLINVCL